MVNICFCSKLFGAKYSMIDEDNTDLVLSPRDYTGCGTHVALVAANNRVSHATFDDVNADGVDIISVSIAGIRDCQHDDFRDVLFVASFHAMHNEVLNLRQETKVQNKHLCRMFHLGFVQKLVKGKIMLCEGNIGGPEAFRAGAIGVLTQGHTFIDSALPFALPGCYL
ncbi:uncharacterized protein [Cicer arietinum]|uniref:uncharacterized protein n=1 Tax=Cicer arietinum TaxID=3827 RepID=UPI003CC67DBA